MSLALNSHLSLNALKTFTLAAKLKSFKKAALILCITPSAVSQQIKSLEAQLDVVLFHRRHQALELTEAGIWFEQQLAPLIESIQNTSTKLVQRFGKTTLRISCMPPVASRVIFPNLRSFQQAYPEIHLKFDVSLKHVDLAHSEVDLAIRYGTPPWEGCDHQKLLDLYIQALSAPQIADQFDLEKNPENLVHAPLIHMTSRPESWQLALSALKLSKTSKSNSGLAEGDFYVDDFYVDDYPASIEAAYNLGVALALIPIENSAIRAKQLIPVGPIIGQYSEVYAVTKKGRLAEPAIQIFLKWLQDHLEQLD